VIADADLSRPDGTLYEREFWGIARHALVAGTAETMLAERPAEEVRRILTPLDGATLADIAGWADAMKRHRPDPAVDDPDTVAFLEDDRNHDNGNWHFVNLPLDAGEYSRADLPAFTRDDDIVQIINEGVRALLGHPGRFSELNALRLIVHLVGDVHQPIHVGCGYLDTSGALATLVRGPAVAAARNLPHDRGGNRLILPVGAGVSLHAYWDSRLGGGGGGHDQHEEHAAGVAADPAKAPDPALVARFVGKLRAMVDRDRRLEADAAADPVPPDRRAAVWATESLIAARSAYQSLVIVGPHPGDADDFDVSWEGRHAYDARCKPIVEQQLTAAADNLAALLNAIWP
jgi:hypothetical protein